MHSIIKRWFKWFIEARWLWTNVQIATLQRFRKELLLENRYSEMKRLNKYEFQVFSQNGEDGIISEILRRINAEHRVFVEIGVGNGLENNTTYLLQQGWKGYWLEGNRKAVRFISKHFMKPISDGYLRVKQGFVRADNVNEMLEEIGVPNGVDLLSVDIDRNTYYVLEAVLLQMRPRVIVTEYTALYPPPIEWRVDYAPKKLWDRSSYAGASLKTYELLGKKVGYSLVGCDLCGVNAFFVRDDLLNDYFLPPYTAENHYEPFRDFLIHRAGPPRQYTDLH